MNRSMVRRHAIGTFVLALTASCNVRPGPVDREDHGPDEPLGSARQGIVGGGPSEAAEDATVMLVFHPPGAERSGICTGALVAPRLVLTARHCVAATNESVACDADGTPIVGGEISGNHDPADLFVFVGKDRPDLDPSRWRPNGQGLEILDDDSRTLCDHDLALVLLKEPIEGAPLASLRLDRDVSIGEKLVTVGWGVSSSQVEPSERQRRGGVTVRRIGPEPGVPALTSSEFLFDESICLGDSGGPIFSQDTGAIVGVVSRGGNGADPTSGGPASTCVEADNLGTKLSPFRDLVRSAFERAGATPHVEPTPDDGCSVSAPGASSGRQPQTRAWAGAFALVVAGFLRRKRAHRTRNALRRRDESV